ncbi:hypothetical protein [Streptomyces monashensis]|uniref:Uncharacterized protein n=1 Tax=Streptomyces monashensis TaxID=1678012 RepID=A0A1S2NZ39_9ACTN|nr:hypothetical protein [Streptomyces monashensis]OIJ86747.1 hypothetical protein BIV23_43475 [Streptomyces monashensis]
MGKHTFNPHAPLGSVDNPVIIAGGKQDQNLALLTPVQLQAMNKMKKDLEAQARNHKPAVKTHTTMKPMGYDCAAEESLYWCDQENISYGTWDEGTYLGSDSHEYLQAEGDAPGKNFQVYVDQTWNNGQNWNGPTGQVTNQAWSWTPSFYDGAGYQDRGCLYNMDASLVACGPWH